MTVSEMGSRLSSREFTEWQAFYAIEDNRKAEGG